MKISIKSPDDIDFKNKKVLIRVDYNVPMYKNGAISDHTRIDVTLQTIEKVISKGGIPMLMTHFGRPEGKRVALFELDPIADYLKTKLKKDIYYLKNLDKEKVMHVIDLAGQSKGIVLFENLRFWEEEEKNDNEFAKLLASFGDVYINEAFSCSHRAHASIVGIPKYIKEKCGGYYFLSEIENLNKICESKAHPMTIILGGAKIGTKIGIIRSLIGPADNFLIGGALANTFLQASGYEIGKSKTEEDKTDLARELMLEIEKDKDKIYLPVDVEVCDEVSNSSYCANIIIDGITPDMKILDIGKNTANNFIEVIKNSKTIIWNGPLGLFEMNRFTKGTELIAKAIASNRSAISLVGGGDTIDALNKLGIKFSKFTHVSTAGGAMIEFIEKRTLVGIESLE